VKRSLLIDSLVGLLLVAAGAFIALQFLHAETRRSYFFDWELAPAVFMACGHGFSQPAAPIAALTSFTQRQSEGFDCEAIDSGSVQQASALANQNRYGLFGPALAMSVGGVSWRTLDYYVAALFGLSIALTYGLMRLFSMRGIAVAGALVMALSTKVTQILSHRDYIKEPAFLALLLIVGWLVIGAPSRRRAWIASAAAGVMLGVGIGCRADLMIFGPFLIAAITLFVGWEDGGKWWRDRAIALLLLAVGFMLTGVPILRSISGGSNLSHTILLGLTTPFTKHLGLTTPAYDLGTVYSDGYGYTLIAAQARLRERNRGPVPFGQPEYDQAGGRLYIDIAKQFPADTLVRGYGAIAESLDHPLTFVELRTAQVLPGWTASRVLRAAADWRFRSLQWLEDRGVLITALALAVVAGLNLRVALAAATAVAYFCAYSMMQFAPRHTFHLDVFTILSLALLMQVLVTSAVSRWRKAITIVRLTILRNVAVFVTVFAAASVTPLLVLRAWQQRQVTSILETTLAAASVPAPFITTSLDGGKLLIQSPSFGQRVGPGPDSDVRDVRMDYVVVEFGGTGCGSGPIEVGLKYSGVVQTIDKQFDRPFAAHPPPGDGRFRILAPLFYEFGPYWLRADGFVLPADRITCVQAIHRVEDPGALPMPFLYAQLGPAWQTSPLYQRFDWE